MEMNGSIILEIITIMVLVAGSNHDLQCWYSMQIGINHLFSITISNELCFHSFRAAQKKYPQNVIISNVIEFVPKREVHYVRIDSTKQNNPASSTGQYYVISCRRVCVP